MTSNDPSWRCAHREKVIVKAKEQLEVQKRLLQRLLDANGEQEGSVSAWDVDRQRLEVLKAEEYLLRTELEFR